MNKKYIWKILTIFTAMAISVTAEVNKEEILKRIAEKYKNVGSVSGVSEVTISQKGKIIETSARFWGKGEKRRAEMTFMEQEAIHVFDGRTSWTYTKSANLLTIQDTEKFPELKEKLTGKYESPASALYIPQLLTTAADKLHIETDIKNGRMFYRIEIVDIGEWEVMPELNLQKAVIWIDADTLFPGKTEFYGEDETSWIKGSFADISLEPMPDTLFKMDVPPDARIDDLAERVGNLQNRGICISKLKAISVALRRYAQDNDGRFPKSLSELYPKYVTSLKTFICPSTQPQPTENDIKENFNLSYEYVSGLNINSPHDCPIVFDRKENHKDGVNAAFINFVRWIPETEWQEILRKHQGRGNND